MRLGRDTLRSFRYGKAAILGVVMGVQPAWAMPALAASHAGTQAKPQGVVMPASGQAGLSCSYSYEPSNGHIFVNWSLYTPVNYSPVGGPSATVYVSSGGPFALSGSWGGGAYDWSASAQEQIEPYGTPNPVTSVTADATVIGPHFEYTLSAVC